MLGRFPNYKNDVKAYLDIRLEEWAHWFSKPDRHGLSWPSASTLDRIRKYGFVITDIPGPTPEAANTSAEQIEKWVNELARIYPEASEALRHKYFTRADYGDKKRASEELAEKQSIHYRTFQSRINTAKIFLISRIVELDKAA